MKKHLFLSVSILALIIACSKEDEPAPPPPTPKFTVSFSAGEGGSVSTSGGTYDKGTKVSVTATPEGEFVFDKWSDGNTDNPREITVSSNLSLSASFVKKKYALSVTVEGEGTVEEEIIVQGSTSSTEYNSGTTVKLTATPSDEWVFSGWSGDIESTDNPIEVTVSEAKSITATFELKQYDLSITVEGEGTVEEEVVVQGSTTSSSYYSGDTVKLTAIPSDGWVFSGWSGAIESTDNPLTITVNANTTITASFNRNNIQEGYDQPAVTNRRIALIPLDFNDTENSIKERFPTKNELLNIITSEKLRSYFSTISYDIFEYDVEVFDYVHLQQAGLIDGSIYGDEIFNSQLEIPNLDPAEFDYLMFVPIHDYQLAGGRQNKWSLTINGTSFSEGQINSIMVPILVGYPNRDTQYGFQNSTVFKKQYSIPLGPSDSVEGDVVYDFSNFEQTFIHELIHALGIGTHSLSKTNGPRPDYEAIIDSNNGLEDKDYGDKFCVMGSGEYSVSLTSTYRDFLGWHNSVVRKQLNNYGVYQVDLYPLNSKDNTAFIEVRIPNQVSEFSFLGYKNEGYFLEVRSQNDPQDSFLSNTHLNGNLDGIFVRKTDGYSSWLLDMSPSENINYYNSITADIRDVVLKPNMIYENEDIRITVISKNQDGSFKVEVEIKD
jgi:hypothetical protein